MKNLRDDQRRGARALAAAVSLALLAAWPAAAQTHKDMVRVSAAIPDDIDGGAFDNGLQNAAIFAWNEFIALNWPALPGKRDVADNAQLFGTGKGPTVWETFRSKVEVYPGTAGSAPPHGGLNYNDPPKYIYSAKDVATRDGQIAPCAGETPQPIAWINLDETSEIGVNQTFAGSVRTPDPSGKNSAPQLIRYAVKTHHVEYQYVLQNQYWYESTRLAQAERNYAVAAGRNPPENPLAPFVQLPTGTIEVKSAWRPLAPSDDPRRYHTAVVRYYEAEKGVQGKFCYRQAVWALIGMHIIHKTKSGPWLVWATFEQADNNLTANGQPVEDENGVMRITGPVTTPALRYQDSPTNPTVSIIGSQYCTMPGARLYFRESRQLSGLPTGGNICADRRFHPIPQLIVNVNKEAHAAIAAYLQQHKLSGTPWQYYKLVNVQPQPFDKSNIDPVPGGAQGPATYYTANGVTETDYSLGVFSGRIAKSGAPTDFTPDGKPGVQNTVLLPFQGRPVIPPVNMGGCTGCHAGGAAASGHDFSFILGETTSTPEIPSSFQSPALRLRYRQMLAPLMAAH